MRHNLLKSFILILALVGATRDYGYAEVEQSVTTDVQPSVAISKTISQESGSIEPSTGVNTGLNASFNIQTNGTDDDYDFIERRHSFC